jgi:Cd2+/Zn2+-exporting ATPase
VSIPRIFGGATAIPGKAVTARLRQGFASVASPRHAAEVAQAPEEVLTRIRTLEDDGKTVVVVAIGKRVCGLLALRDEPRPDAAAGIARLKALGIRPMMLTGDNPAAASAMARRLDVEALSGLLPDAKLAVIAELKRQGPVAMIGDGINDAPALAGANVGVAMGSGTEAALEAADAALLKNRVLAVAEMVALSRATLSNIRQNVSIALLLKVLFLATTLVGLTSLWMAILADTGATVLVTANALRLLGFRGGPTGHARP